MLLEKGAWMDSDLNKYDLDHRVSHHPKMSDAEWEEAYRGAWSAYFTPDHVRSILAAWPPTKEAHRRQHFRLSSGSTS